MLAVFSRNPASSFGLTTMLDIERISYRRVRSLDAMPDHTILVAADDLSDAELDALRERRSIVLHGGGVAARLLGAVRAQAVTQPCEIALDAPIWPADVCALALRHNLTALRLPDAPQCLTTPPSHGQILATTADGGHATVVRDGKTLWCAIDLGAAFTTLCAETYLPSSHQHQEPAPWLGWLRRQAEHVYYAAPERLRNAVQSYSYRQLEPRLAAMGAAASTYPIDASGWLLVELLKRLIGIQGGRVIRLARWPAPYTAAATLTHDIEPRRYAYTTGLDRLLHATAAEPEISTFGLVVEACEQHLPDANALCLEHRNVMCHGLTHRGETVSGRALVAAQLSQARHRLERRLRRKVDGYRSPRLDRSADLLWALDHEGFRFDSSYPDVDRENLRHFGGGVRLNVPFRPPIRDDNEALRPSHCMELPMTAPDCIQPLYAGETEAELHATITRKAAFLRDTGGLYVALIHAGVFGDHDAARRERLLRHVQSQLHHPSVWLAAMTDIVAWWSAREAVELTVSGNNLLVCNGSDQLLNGLQVLVDNTDQPRHIALPSLPPGREVQLSLAGDDDAGTAMESRHVGAGLIH